MRKLALVLAACVALAGCGSRDETTVPKTQAPTRVVVPVLWLCTYMA